MDHADLVVHASGPKPTAGQLLRELFEVAFALPLFATAPLLRRWHRRWGASDAEVAATMPGDALVPGCQYVITRAINISAPPQAVWPWLVQVGFGKAGFYSHDLLDNFGHPSADHVIVEHQTLRIGDWVPMFTKVNDTTAFKVVDFEFAKHLLWLKPDSTWAWQLFPLGTGTRLVTRIRILYRWHMPAEALFSLVLNEFGDFAMMRKMLRTMKRRVESQAVSNAA